MYEIEILLIDDNPVDIQLMQETFNQNKLKNNLNIVSNGSEAVALLKRELHFPQPDLILLDSAFPQSPEYAIFDAIKQDDRLRDVPLVMLIAAGSRREMPVMYDHSIAPIGFVTKPLDFIQFMNVIKTIKSFRLAIVTFL